jgi:hypothetical protein
VSTKDEGLSAPLISHSNTRDSGLDPSTSANQKVGTSLQSPRHPIPLAFDISAVRRRETLLSAAALTFRPSLRRRAPTFVIAWSRYKALIVNWREWRHILRSVMRRKTTMRLCPLVLARCAAEGGNNTWQRRHTLTLVDAEEGSKTLDSQARQLG